MKSADYFFSNPAHRQTDRQKEGPHNLRLVDRGNKKIRSAVQDTAGVAAPEICTFWSSLKVNHTTIGILVSLTFDLATFKLYQSNRRNTEEHFVLYMKQIGPFERLMDPQTDRQTHRSMHDAPQNSTRLLQWQTTISRPVHAVYTSAASTTTTTTTTTTTSTTTTNTNNLRSCFASLFPVQ